LVAAARRADSAARVLELAQAAQLPLADAVAARARRVADAQLDGRVAVEVVVFGRTGEILGRSPN